MLRHPFFTSCGLSWTVANPAWRQTLCRKCISASLPTALKRSRSCSLHASISISDRTQHNENQLQAFSKVHASFTSPLPADVDKRLRQIVGCIPNLGPASRVVDVGAGTGCLIPYLQDRGITDILAVDLSPAMLDELQQRYGQTSLLGNDLGVRTWVGDVVDLPAYMGPADAFLMNASFGNFFSQRDALLRAAMMLKPGGHLVISHPLGRHWHSRLHESDPALVPHLLPEEQQLQAMLADLPLQLLTYVDEPELYMALLQVPERYWYRGAPVVLEGKVVTGFGRGSRQLGFPTANIDPQPLEQLLATMPLGVYFGWAQLDAPAGAPAADSAVQKVVLNIGRRPTISQAGETDLTVECHILHSFAQDFYGCHLKVLALGFVRPEMRFAGLAPLVRRIQADAAIARVQLDDPHMAAFRTGEHFRQ